MMTMDELECFLRFELKRLEIDYRYVKDLLLTCELTSQFL